MSVLILGRDGSGVRRGPDTCVLARQVMYDGAARDGARSGYMGGVYLGVRFGWTTCGWAWVRGWWMSVWVLAWPGPKCGHERRGGH